MHVRFGTGFAHRFTSLDWFANINNGMMWTIKIMCAIWIISYARIVRRSGSCIAPAAEKIVGIPRQQLFLLTLAMLSVAEKRNSLDALNALSHYLVYFDWIIFRFPSKLSRWPQISRRLLEFLIDRRRSLFENMSRFWSWSEYSEHLSIEFGMGKRIETSAAHRLFQTISISSKTTEYDFSKSNNRNWIEFGVRLLLWLFAIHLGEIWYKFRSIEIDSAWATKSFYKISFISHTKFNAALVPYTCTSIASHMHIVNELNAYGLIHKRLPFNISFHLVLIECV